jgi:RHS repeat-associated protein
MADVFRMRFSTKCYDPENGLYYYGYRFYSPALMRWLNRDPIDEAGGLNLYEFCGNCSICFYDALGNLVITGAYPSQDKSPSILDQLGFMPLPHGEEKWFERNYAGWLAEARRRFSVEIERGIDCKSTSFNGPSIRINIEPSENRRGSTSSRTPGGNERKYGDAGQSDWSADKVLGCFSIDYVTPVKITYTNMGGGKRRYSWSTEMYIYDVLGTQDHDPIRKIPVVGDIIGSLTPSRGVKRATWTLSGSGECDCCRGK